MVGVFTRIARGVSGDHHTQLQQALDSKPVLSGSLKDAIIGSGKLDLAGLMEEFAPVEHPLEPQDNDKPVRCPPPEPCIVHDGRIWKERIVASAARRRAEYPIARESSLPTSYQRRMRLEHNNFLLPSFSAPEKHLLKLLEDAKPSKAHRQQQEQKQSLDEGAAVDHDKNEDSTALEMIIEAV